MAGGADHAMREDLVDLRQRTESGFAEMRGKFGAAAAGHQRIVNLLNTLIARQEGQPGAQ